MNMEKNPHDDEANPELHNMWNEARLRPMTKNQSAMKEIINNQIEINGQQVTILDDRVKDGMRVDERDLTEPICHEHKNIVYFIHPDRMSLHWDYNTSSISFIMKEQSAIPAEGRETCKHEFVVRNLKSIHCPECQRFVCGYDLKPITPTVDTASIAWKAWEEDQKTNPNPVNPYAFVYGYEMALNSQRTATSNRELEQHFDQLEQLARDTSNREGLEESYKSYLEFRLIAYKRLLKEGVGSGEHRKDGFGKILEKSAHDEAIAELNKNGLFPKQPQQTEWIKCSDRLPEKSGKYLIYGRFTKDSPMVVSQVYFSAKDGKFREIGIIANNVTHWTYLPKSPTNK